MLLISFMLVESFSFLQEFKICVNYVSRYSVRRKHQKIQKIAEITMTVTKIGYFDPFWIFGNISGSF